MLNKKRINSKTKQHTKLVSEFRRTQIKIIKNHRKDIFYKFGIGCDYIHQLMDLLTKDEYKALDLVYYKYALFVRSLGKKVYKIWCELLLCDTYDYEYFKNIDGFTEADILKAVDIMKQVGILIDIGENKEADSYLQALYYAQLNLNKKVDKALCVLNKQNTIRIKKMDTEKVLNEVAPYMLKDLYLLLENIYRKGIMDLDAVVECLDKEGDYKYPDNKAAKKSAIVYLNLLCEKGFINRVDGVYLR